MCDAQGCCMNVRAGFDCMVSWEKAHPGTNDYHCEYCGIYTASKARCNKCEQDSSSSQEVSHEAR